MADTNQPECDDCLEPAGPGGSSAGYSLPGSAAPPVAPVLPIGPLPNNGLIEYPNDIATFGTRNYTPADALLHFDNGDGSAVFTDSGPGFFDPTGNASGKVVTGSGGVLQSSTQVKFGTSSLQLDGVDDFVEVAVTANGINLNTPAAGNVTLFDLYASIYSTVRQWCMGAWVYPTVGGNHCLFSAGLNAANNWDLLYNPTTSTIQMRTIAAGVPTVRVSTVATAIPLATWSRIDVESFVGTDRIYFNGVIVASLAHGITALNSAGPAAALRVGANKSGTIFSTGFVDEVYWRAGAPYNGTNFTPESIAFTI